MNAPAPCVPGCGVCWDLAVLEEQARERIVTTFNADLAAGLGVVAAVERARPALEALPEQETGARLRRTRIRGLPVSAGEEERP